MTSVELGQMLDDATADVLVVGHTHVPFVRRIGAKRLVANPGALLRSPADGFDLQAPGTFGVLDIGDGGVTFSVRRALDGGVVLGGEACAVSVRVTR
jgi:predicted phosphodiesterase